MKTPLRVGSSGSKVLELKQKLTKAGFLPVDTADSPNTADKEGVFDESIRQAVLALQKQKGLNMDGICGAHTWAALLESEWQLGSRYLYLTSPMLRGDDVGSLQRFLGQLGFNAGREDGIFGPDTEGALGEFQLNNNLTVDKICGPDTLKALEQISMRAKGQNVASVKDREKLRTLQKDSGSDKKIFIQKIFLANILSDTSRAKYEKGVFDQLCSAIESQLAKAGTAWDFSNCEISAAQNQNSSSLAALANELPADICIGIKFSTEKIFQTSYFSTDSYKSAGGKHLAELFTELAAPILAKTDTTQITPPKGMRLPLLRETKMWSVFCVMGPVSEIKSQIYELAKVFPQILGIWTGTPKS